MPEDEAGALGGDMVGFNFKVSIADSGLRTQTYWSKAGTWGPVVRHHLGRVSLSPRRLQASAPVVAGRAWQRRALAVPPWKGLSRLQHPRPGRRHWAGASSMDRGPARVPPATQGHPPPRSVQGAAPGGRPLAVSMWTMSSSGRSWARRVLIDRTTILGSVPPTCHPLWCQRVEFQWFAQGSGTVVFYMNSVGVREFVVFVRAGYDLVIASL
nr:unnamed protein product [Digitaria exilis]